MRGGVSRAGARVNSAVKMEKEGSKARVGILLLHEVSPWCRLCWASGNRWCLGASVTPGPCMP